VYCHLGAGLKEKKPPALLQKRKVKMSNKTTSKTESDSFFTDRIFGEKHYKTTISDGSRKVEARGRTPEESQKRASKKW